MKLDPTLWGPPPTKREMVKARIRNLVLQTGLRFFNQRKLTRVTVITDDGVVMEEYDLAKVWVSIQDEGRTIKIWALSKQNPQIEGTDL